MKVIPVASPHAMQTASTTNSSAANEARQRVITMLTKTPEAPQTAHSVDQNNISPEELSAVKPPTPETAQVDTSANTEATPEKIEAKPKVDPTVSRQFAELARKEKALRAKVQQQEQTIKAREDAIKAQESAIADKQQQYEQGFISLEQLKSDTVGMLAKAGISYDELTQQFLNHQPANPRVSAEIEQLKAEIRSLKQATEDSKKYVQEQQQSSYDAAIKQIRTDVKNLVKMDPAFETVRATNSVNDVVELIEQTWKKDGVILSVEDATKEVEDYLVEETMKLTQVGKIQKRIAANAVQTPANTQKPPAPAATQQTQMKTLTNATASTRKLTARERAMLAFKGELKG